MIVITGGLTARVDTFAELREASLAHVHRSRLEDGCLLHSVHVDCENPMRFFFYEKWRDMAAVQVHFSEPGSHEFMRAVRELAATSESINIYESSPVET